MAQTNVQAFSGDVEISSNLAVDTNTLFVDSVGNNVGIGTTTGLVGKLNIYGTANESNAPLRIESADQYAGMIMLDNSGGVQLQSDQGTLRILTDYAADLSGGVEVARLNEHELKLKGARNSRIFIEDTGADNGTYYQGLYIGSPINNTNAGLRMVVTHDNNDPSHRGNIIGFTGGELNISSFADNDTTSGFGTTRMTIKSDGNVGIGTDTPGTTLAVNGNFACRNFHALGSGGLSNFVMRESSANNTNSLTETVRINAQGRPTVVKVNYQGGSTTGVINFLYSSEITFNWNGSTTLSVSTLYVHNNGGTWTVNTSVVSNGTVTLQVIAPGATSYVSLLTQWYNIGGIYVE